MILKKSRPYPLQEKVVPANDPIRSPNQRLASSTPFPGPPVGSYLFELLTQLLRCQAAPCAPWEVFEPCFAHLDQTAFLFPPSSAGSTIECGGLETTAEIQTFQFRGLMPGPFATEWTLLNRFVIGWQQWWQDNQCWRRWPFAISTFYGSRCAKGR